MIWILRRGMAQDFIACCALVALYAISTGAAAIAVAVWIIFHHGWGWTRP